MVALGNSLRDSCFIPRYQETPRSTEHDRRPWKCTESWDFYSSRTLVSKWNPHETTLLLMWDDLTFHLHISCSFCWSLLGFVFVSMLKMQPLGKSSGINSKLNSDIFDLCLTEEGQSKASSRVPADFLKRFVALQGSIWENIPLAKVCTPISVMND